MRSFFSWDEGVYYGSTAVLLQFVPETVDMYLHHTGTALLYNAVR